MHRARGDLPLAELKQRLEHGSSVVELRAVTPEDEPFLARLYATTRSDELAASGWTEEQKATFCQWQFRLQQLDYAQHYPADGHRIVLRDGVPIGRLWLAERPDHLLIVDLALLPEHRSGGIGTLLVRELLAQPGRLPVRLTALRTNPRAISFYERLGFRIADEDEALLVLEA